MKFKIVGSSLIYVEGCYRIIEGENDYEPIEVESPLFRNGLDMQAMSFRLTAVSAENPQNVFVRVLDKRVCGEKLMLSCLVSSLLSALVGEVYFSVTGTNDAGVIAKFDCIRPIPVRDDVTAESLPSKTAAEQLLAQVQLEAQRAVDAANRGAYTLPTASETVLGGVKVDGETITIDSDGVISADIPMSWPAAGSGNSAPLRPAKENTLGGVKSGRDISVDNSGKVTVLSVGGFTVNADVPADAVFTDTVYTLPTASTAVKGGVKVDGTSTTVDENGVLHAAGGGGSYTLSAATAETLGGVKSGGDISVGNDGAVTVNSVGGKTVAADVPADAVFTDTVYTLPTASTTVLGGVKADGTTTTVDENGVLHANFESNVFTYAFSMAASSWTSSGRTDYPYRAALSNSGVTSSDTAEVIFNIGSIEYCIEAEVAPAGATYNGGVYVYAKAVPAADVSGVVVVHKGV